MLKEWQRLITLSTKINVKYKKLFEQYSLATNTVDPSVPGITIQLYIKEEKIFRVLKTIVVVVVVLLLLLL